MFATQPQTPFRQTTHYTPLRPSPLSQRSPNITTPWTMSPHDKRDQTLFNTPVTFPQFNIQTEPVTRHTQTQPSPIPMQFHASTTNPFLPTQTPTSPTPTAKPKFEARYASTIANPLRNTTSRSKTRKMFLNRVRDERDAGRFEARGEQMMHMEHLADRRRWEESMARDGEGVIAGLEEEDDMLPDDAEALDEFILQEEAMEMAMREAQGVPGRVEQLRSNGPDVSFSDDEYDDIFMGLSEPRGYQSQSQSQSQDTDMDMS